MNEGSWIRNLDLSDPGVKDWQPKYPEAVAHCIGYSKCNFFRLSILRVTFLLTV